MVKPGRPLGDKGKLTTAGPEQQEAVKDQILIYLSEGLGGALDKDGLTCQDQTAFIVSLELEKISDFWLEILKIAIVPNHADLVDNDTRAFGKLLIANIGVGYFPGAWDRFCSVDRPTTGAILISILSEQSRLTTPLFTEKKVKT